VPHGAIPYRRAPPRLVPMALDCEVLRTAELLCSQKHLNPSQPVLYENLDPQPAAFPRFPRATLVLPRLVKPVASIARSILVQFKTQPHGEPNIHFDSTACSSGRVVLPFGRRRPHLFAFLSFDLLICIRLFHEFRYASNVYDRSLILHVQLNPQPASYSIARAFSREHLLGFDGEAHRLK